MEKVNYVLKSEFDNLSISVEQFVPKKECLGIVQISHGMAEHKERYEPFMTYLTNAGYIVAIHDHRGHGASVKSKDDLGYFYTKDINAIVDDLFLVTKHLKTTYPNLPLYLFSHSMGTLVARNYLKKYDIELEKVILCGPPTENKLINLGLILNNITMIFHKDHYRSAFINNLSTGAFNKKYKDIGKNAWICSNAETVKEYNSDDLCGFCFTTNGFYNLFNLQKKAFDRKDWFVKNEELPILLIAGADDPVIQGEEMFYKLKDFLANLGYKNISTKLYDDKRHEILNETNSEEVFADCLYFIQTKSNKR